MPLSQTLNPLPSFFHSVQLSTTGHMIDCIALSLSESLCIDKTGNYCSFINVTLASFPCKRIRKTHLWDPPIQGPEFCGKLGLGA